MTHTTSLKWITPDAQREIIECARVSSDPDAAKQSDEKLLRYLIRNEHWSPFEMASACLEINTTRDIGRQLLRHRSFSFQEFSQRYADVNILGDAVLREARMQHPTNRQMSLECANEALTNGWILAQNEVLKKAMEIYNATLDVGIAKEVARAILPEGLTPSRLYMNGTIRSWIHFIRVRSHETAQKEVRLIAESARDVLMQHIPAIAEAAL